MTVYTRPDRREPIFVDTTASKQPTPTLLFQKWQAWDDFENDSAFKRKESRQPYLQNICSAVQKVYESKYRDWYTAYFNALGSQGVVSYPYETVWRLIVGWGNNPTLESGLALHHLYGFPYIPGTAVKGAVHYVAEMDAMNTLNFSLAENQNTLPDDNLEKVRTALNQLRLVKVLFGSIHIEPGKENGQPIGPESPKSFLLKLHKKLKSTGDGLPEVWHEMEQEIENLLDTNTGGMLRFYDAVPDPNQRELLQVDIVNCHYSDYYSSEGATPPSDDQSPKPVTFLAVRPGLSFRFAYKLDEWPHIRERDPQEGERLQALNALTRDSIVTKVTRWLEQTIGELGIGAKTAAGYGYFATGVIEQQQADRFTTNGTMSFAPETSLETAEVINPKAPTAFNSKIKPTAKLMRISKPYNQNLWQRLAESSYIEKIVGKDYGVNAFAMPLPAREIMENGKTIVTYYRHERFYCQVLLKLEGIASREEAEYLWIEDIRPYLETIGE